MVHRLFFTLLALTLVALPASGQSLTRVDGSASTSRVQVDLEPSNSFNPDVLTQSTDLTVIDLLNSVACTDGINHSDNAYLRRFDTTELPSGFTTKDVDMAIESAITTAGTQDIFVNVYSIANGDAFLYANMTLEGTSGAFAVADQDSTFISVPVVATVAAGSDMVVEIFQEDAIVPVSGELLWIGSNDNGQSGLSYIASVGCALPEPTDLGLIGFPGMHIIEAVNGNVGGGGFPVTISCIPTVPDPTIPANGGPYFYEFEIVNTSASSETVEIWFDITGPIPDILRGPFTRTFPAGGGLGPFTLLQGIPAVAPAGAYNHTCNLGTAFPVAEASSGFDFSKIVALSPGETSMASWGTDAELEAALTPPEASAELNAPANHALAGSYPNPFNPSTTIRFNLTESAQVRLAVYDLLGREVRLLLDGTRDAGAYEVAFDASDLPSGTYLYRLETPTGNFVGTMLLAK